MCRIINPDLSATFLNDIFANVEAETDSMWIQMHTAIDSDKRLE